MRTSCNLGAYADPDGRLIFDLNDFDETLPGPWEWDVKRLATSLILAGGEAGETQANCEKAVRAFVASYRRSLLEFAQLPVIDLARHRVSRHREDTCLSAIFAEARARDAASKSQKADRADGSGKISVSRPTATSASMCPPAQAKAVIESLACI